MPVDSERHDQLLARMHSGIPRHEADERAMDFNLASLASSIAAACPHALAFATATAGVEFVRRVGEFLAYAADDRVVLSERVIEGARRTGHAYSEGLGALFDFDLWMATFSEGPILVGRHEAASPALTILESREYPVEVLSFVRFVQQFMGPGMPLELLAKYAPRQRPQRLRATRTARGIEVSEVRA